MKRSNEVEKSENVRNKIMILYIINRLPGITLGELTAMSMDTCYMNYFSFATAFDDLVSSRFLSISTRKGESRLDSEGNPVSRCDITPVGLETMNRLLHLIPAHIHTFLNKAFIDWEKDIKKNIEIRATYDPDLYGGYTVDLVLSDGSRELIRIRISVPTKETAIRICNNWNTNTQSVYLSALSMLSGECEYGTPN